MTTNYPAALDDGSSLPTLSGADEITSATPNTLGDAIKAIEAKVGIGVGTIATGQALIGVGAGESTWVDLADVAVSGDAADLTGTLPIARIADGDVTLAKLADLAAHSVMGNNTGSPAVPLALSVAQVKTLLALAQVDISGLATTDSPRFAGINVGHASDTTITRNSPGDIAIEGNIVYRSGGDVIPVTGGGTGASTAAAALDTLGIQRQRLVLASIAAGGSHIDTITWDVPFADTSYAVSLTLLQGGSSTDNAVIALASISAGSITVRVYNHDTSARTMTVHAIAIHD